MKYLLLVGMFIFSIEGRSEDESTTLATQQTQDLLKNSKARHAAIKENDAAIKNDAYIRSKLTSEKDINEAYGVAAELLPWIVEQSGGDPEKMQAMLVDAQKNPEAFYNRMPAAQRAKIKQLSKAIPEPKKP